MTEVTLKKVLKVKIKNQLKDVLRRADKQRIPMNLPEGEEIAREEVIKLEINAEIDAVRQEQRQDGERIKEKQRRDRVDQKTTTQRRSA